MITIINSVDRAYHKGYERAKADIEEIGFEAVCDRFNEEYPRGQITALSDDAMAFSRGEFDALCEKAR